ncbi:MAG: TolC family protein [Verrucomicrobia bacterium]|nr:TolC family protein [Verrucomicrobiota bacterium]
MRTHFLVAMLCCVAAGAAEPWTLERALEFALAGNPDARLAQQRIVAAQAGLEQANAAFWPRLQMQSSYTRTDNPMMAFGSILNQRDFSPGMDFNNVPDVDDYNVKSLLTVPLYAGGKNMAGHRAARAGVEAARHDSEAVLNALGYEVARAFHTVRKTRRFIEAAEASAKSFADNLAIAKRRADAGAILKTDVLDFEVRLAQAREELVRARNAHALAVRTLRNLLGIESGEFSVADSAPSVSAPKDGDFSGRSELSASRHRERAAEEQVRAARSGYLPRVSAFGSADYDYGWRMSHGGGSYTAGVMLQWDLWDGHLTRGKVREARSNVESAREEQRKLRLAIGLEVEQARLALQTAEERLGVTGQVVTQASESTSLTRSRFEQGLALATQLIDAETALVTARVRRAEAESDRQIAIAALRKSLGMSQLDPSPVAQKK